MFASIYAQVNLLLFKVLHIRYIFHLKFVQAKMRY